MKRMFFLFVMSFFFSSTAMADSRMVACGSTRQESLTKGKQLFRAVQLFVENHNRTWRLDWNDPDSSGLSDGSKVRSCLSAAGKVATFTPPGSADTLNVIQELQKVRHIFKEGSFWVGQIVASSNLGSKLPMVSTFFSASDYANGLAELLKEKGLREQPVFLFLDEDMPYSDEVAKRFESDLERLGFGRLKIFRYSKDRFETAWKSFDYPQKATLVFFSKNPNRLRPVLKNGALDRFDRVFFYGDHFFRDGEVLGPYHGFFGFGTREFHILFWHPRAIYERNYQLSNCSFTRKFLDRFGEWPTFSAAFQYSTMELLDQTKTSRPQPGADYGSVTGGMKFTPKGARAGMRPIILEYNGNGRSFHLPAGVKGFCDPFTFSKIALVLSRFWTF